MCFLLRCVKCIVVFSSPNLPILYLIQWPDVCDVRFNFKSNKWKISFVILFKGLNSKATVSHQPFSMQKKTESSICILCPNGTDSPFYFLFIRWFRWLHLVSVLPHQKLFICYSDERLKSPFEMFVRIQGLQAWTTQATLKFFVWWARKWQLLRRANKVKQLNCKKNKRTQFFFLFLSFSDFFFEMRFHVVFKLFSSYKRSLLYFKTFDSYFSPSSNLFFRFVLFNFFSFEKKGVCVQYFRAVMLVAGCWLPVGGYNILQLFIRFGRFFSVHFPFSLENVRNYICIENTFSFIGSTNFHRIEFGSVVQNRKES